VQLAFVVLVTDDDGSDDRHQGDCCRQCIFIVHISSVIDNNDHVVSRLQNRPLCAGPEMLFLLTLLFAATARGLVTEILAHEEHCFFESLNEKDAFTVRFQVKKGGFLDIDLMISSPSEKVLHAAQRQTEQRLTFTAEQSGVYKVCFGNKFSSLTTKVVVFQIDVSSKSSTSPKTELEAARTDDVNLVSKGVFELGDELAGVEEALRDLRGRMYVHHNTNESTNVRVFYWGIFEAVMTVSVSLFQVWYIKRFFEVRRAI